MDFIQTGLSLPADIEDVIGGSGTFISAWKEKENLNKKNNHFDPPSGRNMPNIASFIASQEVSEEKFKENDDDPIILRKPKFDQNNNRIEGILKEIEIMEKRTSQDSSFDKGLNRSYLLDEKLTSINKSTKSYKSNQTNKSFSKVSKIKINTKVKDKNNINVSKSKSPTKDTKGVQINKKIKLDLRQVGTNSNTNTHTNPNTSVINIPSYTKSNIIDKKSMSPKFTNTKIVIDKKNPIKKVEYISNNVNKSFSKSPDKLTKPLNIVYKPMMQKNKDASDYNLDISRNSYMKKQDLNNNNDKNFMINDIDLGMNNFNNSNWNVTKMTYAELMKKREESGKEKLKRKTSTDSFVNKNQANNSFVFTPRNSEKDKNKSKKELSSSFIDKKTKKTEPNSNIKNINININELNIIKKEEVNTNNINDDSMTSNETKSKLNKLKNLKFHLNLSNLQKPSEDRQTNNKNNNNINNNINNNMNNNKNKNKSSTSITNTPSFPQSERFPTNNSDLLTDQAQLSKLIQLNNLKTSSFKHLHKRSNSFGNFRYENSPKDFNPNFNNLLSQVRDSEEIGEKFSFRNNLTDCSQDLERSTERLYTQEAQDESDLYPQSDRYPDSSGLISYIKPVILNSSKHNDSQQNDSLQTENSTNKSKKNIEDFKNVKIKDRIIYKR